MRRFLLFLLIPGSAFALSYDDDIKPIFREHCLKCHGDDQQKADLNLQNFDTVLKGGSGGKAVVAGRPSQSLLYQAITDPDDDSRMPPKKAPIPTEQAEKIRVWIQEGLLQSTGGKALLAERDLGFSPDTHAGQKPEGPPPMPENLPAAKVPETVRPLPVLAMDVSPWAPLLAVSAEQHVRLIHTETQALRGVLPFPEGVPQVIRF
ncbi:MAG: c-type cytochrome domain-containing protein, partial [Verrucomicrobiales bacterium]